MTNSSTPIDDSAWNIAIIDDEPDIHKVIGLSLDDELFLGRPAKFVSAYSYSQATELLSNSNFDLILLDLVMETDESGLDCLAFIRSNPHLADIPVIIISGVPDHLSEKTIVKQYDLNGFINKCEMRPERLYSELHSALKYAKQLNDVCELNDELVGMQARLQDIFALSDAAEAITEIGGWEWDIEKQEMHWTQGVYGIFSVDNGVVPSPKLMASFFNDTDKQKLSGLFDMARAQGESYEISLPIVRGDGVKRWIKTNGRARYQGQKITHVYGAIQDVTEFLNCIEQSKESNEFLINVLEHFSDAVVVVDLDGIIVEANPAVEKIFGYTREQALNRPVEMLMPDSHARRHKGYVEHYIATGEAQIIGKGRELVGKRSDGSPFPMELTLSEFHYEEKHLFIGIVRDISERKKAQQEVYQLAFHDQVTQLPNLQQLEQIFPNELEKAKCGNEVISMMLIDVDGFYRVNQAFGHQIGDYVLALIADRIRKLLPEDAHLFRATGPDFILFQRHHSDVSEQFIRVSAQQILDEIGRAFMIYKAEQKLSASVGVYLRSALRWDKELSKSISKLELANKAAKDKGGNCLVLFDDGLNQAFKRRYHIENGLKKAVAKGEFSLHYQPKFNTDKQTYSAESLIRWHSPEIGFVPPDEFITVAEQTGLINDIGKWVMETAFADVKRLRTIQPNLSVSINVSANQIIQPDFSELVKSLMEQHQITPDEIILELTETALAKDIKAVVENMVELNELGISFSIDDFGTGYSSLSYLQRLPIDELKIDKSFIDDLITDPTANKLVDTIISLAKSMKLKVVAEGVESEEQFQYLQSRNCSAFQGYLYAKPMKLEEFETFLKA